MSSPLPGNSMVTSPPQPASPPYGSGASSSLGLTPVRICHRRLLPTATSTRGTGAASSPATPPREDAPWRDALRPLREAAALHARDRLAKHSTAGGGGEGRGTERQRALGLFQRAARLGFAAAMVDAGLMCWEEGRRRKAVGYYQRAVELGHPVGMCNLVNFAIPSPSFCPVHCHAPRV